MRFINNSNDPKIINVQPRILLCSTVVRIGMWALRDLEPGEELFFHYGYSPDHTKFFLEKGQKTDVGTQAKVLKLTKTKKTVRPASKVTVDKMQKVGPTNSSAPREQEQEGSHPRPLEDRQAQTLRARNARIEKYKLKKAKRKERAARRTSHTPKATSLDDFGDRETGRDTGQIRASSRNSKRGKMSLPLDLNLEQQFGFISRTARRASDAVRHRQRKASARVRARAGLGAKDNPGGSAIERQSLVISEKWEQLRMLQRRLSTKQIRIRLTAASLEMVIAWSWTAFFQVPISTEGISMII